MRCMKFLAAVSAAALLLAGCATTGDVEPPKPSGPNLDPQVDSNPFPSTYKPLPGVPTALVGATIFDGKGGKIENGTVLLRDGKIEAVGANVTVPADY